MKLQTIIVIEVYRCKYKCSPLTFSQSEDYQRKRKRCKLLKRKLSLIKRRVSDYDHRQ